MGLLDFLNKRPPVDTLSGQKNQTTSAQVRGVIASRESGTRTPDPSQRLLKPRLVGISEVRPGTNPKDSSSTKPFQLKAVGRNPKDSISGLKLDAVPKFSDRERPRSRNDVEQLTPMSLNFPRPRRRSSAFVDILDAQGEIKPSNFKSRIQASGTRDYGEDVADRNMVESLPSPRTRAVYSSLSGSTLPYRPHGSVSTASSSRYAFRGQSALEYPRDNSISAPGFNGRPSSRHTSIRSRPGSRGRVSPATESFDKVMSFDGNDFHDYRPQSKMSYGQISVTGSRASTPQQAPRTADGSYMRDESNTLYDDLRSASPPGVPRYKPRQYSLPSGKFPSGALPGSVRSARENLNNSLLPPHFDRSRRMYQQRCKTPTSPNQLHSFRHRVDNDWSRFNRHAGDHLHPASSAWENASSSASEYAPSFSFGSTGNLQIDDADRQPSIRTFGRRGSISSYAPSDYSGQQLTGGRSIRTADTSIDIPHNSLFNEIKFLGGSSRNLRSRGGDSYIAPDRTGAEEDSGGESIFISPATPSEEQQPPFSPLSPSHRYGGLSISSYDATNASDSDADSFCNEQRQTRRDGEALLFRAQGFGDDGKSLPGLFNGPENLSIPKWPEIPVTPTDVSEMGDDESSVIGLAVTSPEPRQTSPRPFTQRERLLALGYDYDSDSDIETSVDSDEVPEDRALQLLSALVRGRTSAASGSQSTKGPPADMKAIAKLRKDVKRRQRLDASPAGRRSKSSSGERGEVNTATATK
ncbi:hypothetical protein M441DRAFT_138979 [Trichoderma asperellum CBS 433.97]|uniref:Uncharacterized protein n=1 Tax=Trichoderma asperellum (strain ATCC 204424 / CBS 433.97 / NBRC 101777) TaxID=1042311 RepID=A0A2T3ZAG1_TRIA4|nr:hypothetical protein M441DRAFT_138979 [Trichoderma asperellum CBS 433.97]PTB41794.1 hypothetical protein M441DRAFT_138979 [Trichoderma asperellum CBS 433.97]